MAGRCLLWNPVRHDLLPNGHLSYIISIVEANGNRYLFCERI